MSTDLKDKCILTDVVCGYRPSPIDQEIPKNENYLLPLPPTDTER